MEKLRNEIEEKYKWDVDKLVNDFEKCKLEIKELLSEVLKYKGKILESSKTLLNFYKEYETLERKLDYLYQYAHMLCDTDTTNKEYQGKKQKADKIVEEVSSKLSFVVPEILESDYDKVLEYIKENKELEYYKFDLEKIFRDKEHTLSKKEEQVISKTLNAFGTPSEVFYNIDNADIDLGYIEYDNKLEKLTSSNYSEFLNNKDKKIRKQAFEKLYEYYKKLNNTITACMNGNIKEDFFLSDIRKYNSPLEMSLHSDNIDIKVYKTLIEVTHKNLDKLHDYMKLRKKILKLDEMHMYDLFVDLIEEKSKKIPFKEGKEIVLEALKPLGDKYIEDLKQAFTENWIDIYPNKGKKSGAYSWGSFDMKPYLLLNYNDNLDSVNTMAHELGHSMHTYYSKTQGYTYHSYPIFLAEIASTVNEVLLNDYLYKNSKTKEEKIIYVTEMLDKIRTTIYRQTQFAEFEMILHDKYQNGESLTPEEINNIYYELNKKYYGEDIISDDLIKYEWSRIPHFYTSFYVYKYATGLTSALAIARGILNNDEKMKENYLKFLHSGGIDYPLNILKNTGVDIEQEETIQKSFDFFNEQKEKLKQLVK